LATTEDIQTDVQKYPVDYLLQNANSIFGVNVEVLAGSFYGIDTDNLSVDEAKQYIDNFMNRRVFE